jgi:hypothetical protein
MVVDLVNASMPWDEMEESNPPQCLYTPRIDGVLATGEHVVLKHDYFKFPNGASGRFGRILIVENKKFALQLYAQGTDADASAPSISKETYLHLVPSGGHSYYPLHWYHPVAMLQRYGFNF